MRTDLPAEGVAMTERDIFLAALDIDCPTDRASYVAHACADNAAMRGRLEAMLAFHDQENSFLSAPCAETHTWPRDGTIAEGEGTVIGRYKLLEKIGEGGFAIVFMAEQTEPIRRRVALKVIKPGMDSKQVIGRFEVERQALALMDHPNIAKVFDGGVTDSGRPYFVMELVNGVPLIDYCDNFKLDTSERLAIFVQICRAVQHAHQKGIIHRDLKPSNVLVTLHDDKPVPKVIDFGIAKATLQRLTERTVFTRFQHFIGTPAYMSPEQATFSGLDIDTRSDIYSLGVLLYELLTGVTPFDKQKLCDAAYDELCRIIRDEQPPTPSTRISTLGQQLKLVAQNRRTDPRELQHAVHGELDWIVMKALEKERNRRYETANALAMDVQRFLANEPVLACPPSPWYRFRKFARRNRARLAVAGLLLVVLLVGAVGGTVLSLQRGAALQRTQEAERLAIERLFDSYLNEAQALRSSRDAGRYFAAWKTLQKATALAPVLGEVEMGPLRNEAVAIMALRADLEVIHEHEQTAANWFIGFDPRLEYFAGPADAAGTVVVRRAQDGREAFRLPAPIGRGLAHVFRYSGDGRYLAVWHQSNRWRLWDLNDPNQPALLREVANLDRFYYWATDFSDDGRALAVALASQVVQVYALPSGEPLLTLRVPFQPAALRFHPDGRKLALSHGASVEIWDRETSARLASLPQPAQVLDLAWHPHREYLAISCDDQCTYVCSAETGHRLMVLAGTHDSLCFNQAGDLLATHSPGGITKVWDPWSGDLLLTAAGRAVRFSNDDRKLAFCTSRRAGVWQVQISEEYRLLAERPEIRVGHLDLGVGLDGNLLVAGSNPGGMRLWDLRFHRQVGEVRPPDWHFNLLFHTPSQSLLSTGASGIYRWPLKLDHGEQRLRIGPPEKMYPRILTRARHASLSGDGRLMAVVLDWHRVRVLSVGHEAEPVAIDGHRVDTVALGRDGQWAVTACSVGTGVRLWNTRTATLICDLWPASSSAAAVFSPDGQHLAARTVRECRCWRVGSWNEPAWKISSAMEDDPGGIAFSPDGRLLALRRSNLVLQLLDAATGREVVTLEAPRHARPGPLCFSPDGTRLFESNQNLIAVWDLRRIRSRLAGLGLDWSHPPYPAAQFPAGAAPLTVEVDYGDGELARQAEPADSLLQQFWVLARSGAYGEAIDQLGKLLERAPNYRPALNNLAWQLATCPDEKYRDPPRAVELAKKAVELAPRDGIYWNTLGVAQYRAGDYQAAIEALAKAEELEPDTAFAFNAFFLAMANWQLEQTDMARQWYERAVVWMKSREAELQANPTWNDELRRFRSEAESLIGEP